MNRPALSFVVLSCLALLLSSCFPFSMKLDGDDIVLSNAGDDSAPLLKPAPSGLPAEGPLAVTVQDAIIAALAGNKSIVLERFGPELRRSALDQQLAAFDTTFGAGVSGSRRRTTAER